MKIKQIIKEIQIEMTLYQKLLDAKRKLIIKKMQESKE